MTALTDLSVNISNTACTCTPRLFVRAHGLLSTWTKPRASATRLLLLHAGFPGPVLLTAGACLLLVARISTSCFVEHAHVRAAIVLRSCSTDEFGAQLAPNRRTRMRASEILPSRRIMHDLEEGIQAIVLRGGVEQGGLRGKERVHVRGKYLGKVDPGPQDGRGNGRKDPPGWQPVGCSKEGASSRSSSGKTSPPKTDRAAVLGRFGARGPTCRFLGSRPDLRWERNSTRAKRQPFNPWRPNRRQRTAEWTRNRTHAVPVA